MGYADVRRRQDLARDRGESAIPWRAVKDNPYLSLAAGPAAGLLAGWFSMSVWGTHTYAGAAIHYTLMLVVLVAFIGRGALLFSQRDQRNPRRSIAGEKQLLVVVRDSDGLTPVEASLTVDEADAMLSRLTERGHLHLHSHDGTLFYTLPGRRPDTLEERPAPQF